MAKIIIIEDEKSMNKRNRIINNKHFLIIQKTILQLQQLPVVLLVKEVGKQIENCFQAVHPVSVDLPLKDPVLQKNNSLLGHLM